MNFDFIKFEIIDSKHNDYKMKNMHNSFHKIIFHKVKEFSFLLNHLIWELY